MYAKHCQFFVYISAPIFQINSFGYVSFSYNNKYKEGITVITTEILSLVNQEVVVKVLLEKSEHMIYTDTRTLWGGIVAQQ